MALTVQDLIKAFEYGWKTHRESQQTTYIGVKPPDPNDVASEAFDQFVREEYPDLVKDWEKTTRE